MTILSLYAVKRNLAMATQLNVEFISEDFK